MSKLREVLQAAYEDRDYWQGSVMWRIAKYTRGMGPGCHVWTGAVDTYGYGILGVSRFGRTCSVTVPRLVWMDEHGLIPEDAMVLHSCHNRPCVNGEHLYLGDHDRNMLDMAEAGRSNSSLNWTLVDAARRAHAIDGATPSDLARTLGRVNRQTWNAILLNQSWHDPDWVPHVARGEPGSYILPEQAKRGYYTQG